MLYTYTFIRNYFEGILIIIVKNKIFFCAAFFSLFTNLDNLKNDKYKKSINLQMDVALYKNDKNSAFFACK